MSELVDIIVIILFVSAIDAFGARAFSVVFRR